ncbi:hypothetical protein [Clostridium thailandense]|uniref:hypothetical protein n=1 Tax=Clostridium thailandense TaxID=2794346 RepID=UPI003988E8F9
MSHDSVFTLLALGGIFALITLILSIALYVLSSIGLYKLAINQHIGNPWIAWIPIANLYILGSIIKIIKIDSYEILKLELVLPIGCLLSILLNPIPLIGWIFSIVYFVLFLISVFKLFKLYRPSQAAIWLVISIILPFMGPIFIFIMRNDTPVS